MKVLVAGGAGYIGSTVCSALLDAGHIPVILDNLITGRVEFVRDRLFYKGDIGDLAQLKQIFAEHPDIEAAIHMAALIVVPDSVRDPFGYYSENVAKSIQFFKNIIALGCKKIVFSSSASIYDKISDFAVDESSSIKPLSPYARTKYMMEMVLEDFCAAYGVYGIALRYFNPIGADPKMRTGLQQKLPTHALGALISVATGKRAVFEITGTQYPTRDGSGIRDYVHVWDLAQAHVRACGSFERLFKVTETDQKNKCYEVFNLGLGNGVTVFELVAAFERVYGKPIAKQIAVPRPGDAAGAYAVNQKARTHLNWDPLFSLDQAIADALKWDAVRDSILH